MTQSTVKSTGWAQVFEAIADRIPVLRGYRAKEGMRDVDKILRTQTAERMARIKNGLDEVKRRLTEKGKIGMLDQIDRLTRILGKLRDIHRFDAYGYSGYFDPVKVREQELERIYRYDLDIVEKLEALEGSVPAIEEAADTEAGLRAAIGDFEASLGDLEKAVLGRKEAVTTL